MLIFDFKKKINYSDMKIASSSVRSGKLVIFPTETVYGIGADACNENAVKNIFLAKGRKSDNPLIVHIADFNNLNKYVYKPNNIEQKLMNNFMPGPFTLILKKKKIIPNIVSGGLDTVGIRMPSNKIAHELIKLSGSVIAAPSANKSSKPSGTKIEDIFDEFKDNVDIMIDGGETEIGVESTVVRVIDGIPTILRPGKITAEDIKEVIGIVKIDDNIFKKSTGPVLSPGMKYKHYAPENPCLLLYDKSFDKLKNLLISNTNKETVIIGPSELKYVNCKKYLDYGNYKDLDSISHNIFSFLRKADTFNPKLIIIIGVSKNGLGLAIMNRLIRACNYNYIINE